MRGSRFSVWLKWELYYFIPTVSLTHTDVAVEGKFMARPWLYLWDSMAGLLLI